MKIKRIVYEVETNAEAVYEPITKEVELVINNVNDGLLLW